MPQGYPRAVSSLWAKVGRVPVVGNGVGDRQRGRLIQRRTPGLHAWRSSSTTEDPSALPSGVPLAACAKRDQSAYGQGGGLPRAALRDANEFARIGRREKSLIDARLWRKSKAGPLGQLPRSGLGFDYPPKWFRGRRQAQETQRLLLFGISLAV